MLNTIGSGKSPEAFRTISEASEEIGVPPHVLRFWEGKFSNLRPLKRAGGRRFYRPQDMAVLRGLKALLQDDGYTIKGVQKLIKDNGIQSVRDRASNLGSFETKAFARDDDNELNNSVEMNDDTAAVLVKAVKRLEVAVRQLDSILAAQD